MFIEVYPVIDTKVYAYCLMPYPGHPHGCPNFNKADKCPPRAPRFDKYFNMTHIYAVIGEFNLRRHMERMKEANPTWTIAQQRCVLYWQNTARKALWDEANHWLKKFPGYEATQCPEGMGVHVIQTLSNVGIRIVSPPTDIVHLVIMMGKPREKAPVKLPMQLDLFND